MQFLLYTGYMVGFWFQLKQCKIVDVRIAMLCYLKKEAKYKSLQSDNTQRAVGLSEDIWDR